MDTLDLLLRAATFALAIAAATAIMLRPARHAGSRSAAFAVAGIGAFMVASAPGAYAALGLATFAFNAWCLATPVAVWMLARTLFGDGPRGSLAWGNARPSAWYLAAGGALVILTLAGDYGRYQLGPLASSPDVARALLLAGRVAAIGLLGAALYQAIAHWRADLVEQRRRLRAGFVGVIGIVFACAAASELIFGGRGAPLGFLVVAHAALLVLAFALLQLVARGGMEVLAPAPEEQPAAPRLAVVRDDTAEAALAERVVQAMERQKLWQHEGLGIADLARILGSQEYLLRRAINRRLGYRNFNDFLHDYRLREASTRLADPSQAHESVLTVALDCGYGSIGPFNRAFKVRFGVTPSQYRQFARSTQPAPVAIKENT